jgi:hypothetical protein
MAVSRLPDTDKAPRSRSIKEAAMSTAGESSREGASRSRAGVTDWRTRWAAPPRVAYTSETKPFFLTSEFLAFVLLVMGLGIGASTSDDVDARLFWILTTAATGLYMLSRGIAKSGSRSRAYDPREDLDLGRPDERVP